MHNNYVICVKLTPCHTVRVFTSNAEGKQWIFARRHQHVFACSVRQPNVIHFQINYARWPHTPTPMCVFCAANGHICTSRRFARLIFRRSIPTRCVRTRENNKMQSLHNQFCFDWNRDWTHLICCFNDLNSSNRIPFACDKIHKYTRRVLHEAT